MNVAASAERGRKSKRAAYRSELRDAQVAGTRQQILDAVAALIESGQEPTFAAIAKQARVQERTVYRYFPSKEELYEAFWWQVVNVRVGPTPYEAGDLTALVENVRSSFRGFGANAALVTEMTHSKYGLAIRLRTNDRRSAMFERIVKHELPDADPAVRRRVAAITQLLYSGTAWHSLRAYWGMDAAESIAAVEQALVAMFAGLRVSTRRSRR